MLSIASQPVWEKVDVQRMTTTAKNRVSVSMSGRNMRVNISADVARQVGAGGTRFDVYRAGKRVAFVFDDEGQRKVMHGKGNQAHLVVPAQLSDLFTSTWSSVPFEIEKNALILDMS